MSEKEKLIREYEEYAKRKGFRLNPNYKVVDAVIEGLIMNEKKYGKRLCPCRRPTGDPEKDKRLECPCFEHIKDVREKGNCHCLLFVK